MLNLTQCFITTLKYGVLLFITSSAQASLLGYSFTGTVDSGSLNGEILNGQFTFNDAALTHSGFESLSLLSFSLDFHAANFSLANADTAPSVDFQDGTFLGLSYTDSSFDPGFSLVSGFIDTSDAYFAYTPTGLSAAGFGSLTYTASAVPEPEIIWSLLPALSGLAVFSRRKQAKILTV
jgi:hypothetical protein